MPVCKTFLLYGDTQPKQGAMLEQPQTRPELLQRFRNVSYLGDEEAKYYLESNGWDLGRAVAEWRSEKIWESQSQVRRVCHSPRGHFGFCWSCRGSEGEGGKGEGVVSKGDEQRLTIF